MDIYKEILKNKENIDFSNYQNYNIINNYASSKAINNNYINYNDCFKKIKNSKKINKSIHIYNNETSNDVEDLDIELNSISKIIPLNNFYNVEQTKDLTKIKSKIKRRRRTNSILNNTLYSKNSEEKILNNNINNNIIIYNNTNSSINTSINSTINNKNIKRYNTSVISNPNKFINNKDKTSDDNNNVIFNNNNYQQLFEENQKLKKENKRLFIKNNELALKLRTQEVKTKINNKQNNNNNKRLPEQKEEFYLQKIRVLEAEIIKQKDLITKLTYQKRFNIGIRKIRINSFILKGRNNKDNNTNKIKRRNSINICKKNNYTIHYNNTLPNKSNKSKSKKIQSNSVENSIKTDREELNKMIIKPILSSTHSMQKKIEQKFQKKFKNCTKRNKENNNSNLSMNNSLSCIGYNNRENSVDFRLEDDIFKGIIKNIKKNKKGDKSVVINNKDNRIMKNKKIRGKTNLIMSVINFG